MGNISFRVALVIGNKRVPSPAAGMTALRTLLTFANTLYGMPVRNARREIMILTRPA